MDEDDRRNERTNLFTAATFAMVSVGVVMVALTFVMVLTFYYGGIETHCIK